MDCEHCEAASSRIDNRTFGRRPSRRLVASVIASTLLVGGLGLGATAATPQPAHDAATRAFIAARTLVGGLSVPGSSGIRVLRRMITRGMTPHFGAEGQSSSTASVQTDRLAYLPG